jgi:hypothetical protein
VKDLSTGPAVIATYGVTMIVVGVVLYVARAPRRAPALRNVAVVAALFTAAGVGMYVLGAELGEVYRAPRPAGDHAGADAPESDGEPLGRLEAVLQALDADPPRGVALALALLREDPPPFHRERVIDRLAAVLGEDPGFDPGASMESPVNREALERIERRFDLR